LRVVSLCPAATEIVAALGAEDLLVGVSHECDYPPSIDGIQRVTWTPVDPGQTSREIDAAVRGARADGRPVIAVDGNQLERLRVDLILTQGLCEVCAVAEGETISLAGALSTQPRVVSLQGRDLMGVEADIHAVGAELDRRAEAATVIGGMRDRLHRLEQNAASTPARVACVEWLDPLYLAGHWVPELIAAAGGMDVGARPGDHSRVADAAELAALHPDLILVMLCGFSVERSLRELDTAPLPDLGVPVWVLDGNAYTSRPGPRLADGAERIQAAMRGQAMTGLTRWR
jgi:iron complex transport system substrate-binding protein